MLQTSLDPFIKEKDTERGGPSAEFCELCTPLLTTETPEEVAMVSRQLLGRGAQGNFSLLPVNLWPGGKHNIQRKPSTAASLATALDSFYLETQLPF